MTSPKLRAYHAKGDPVDMVLGEAIAWGFDTDGSDANIGLPAAPSAVGTAILYGPGGDVITSEGFSGSASLSGDIITFPTFTPANVTTGSTTGLFELYCPCTVSGNTVYVVRLINVIARPEQAV